jgi:hypothetical protein
MQDLVHDENFPQRRDPAMASLQRGARDTGAAAQKARKCSPCKCGVGTACGGQRCPRVALLEATEDGKLCLSDGSAHGE